MHALPNDGAYGADAAQTAGAAPGLFRLRIGWPPGACRRQCGGVVMGGTSVGERSWRDGAGVALPAGDNVGDVDFHGQFGFDRRDVQGLAAAHQADSPSSSALP
jgi:hypothetical protein